MLSKHFQNSAWEVTVQGTHPSSDWLLAGYSLALLGPSCFGNNVLFPSTADLNKIKSYIDSFRYGAHPHAGGGIGV